MKVLGVNIPDYERIEVGLTRVYGIGRNNVNKVLGKADVDKAKRVKELTKKEVSRLIKALEKFHVEGDLKKQVKDNISRLQKIKCYRGLRHLLSLPCRGQRTKTNARTRKGKKKTVGALSKEAWAKIEQQQRKAANN